MNYILFDDATRPRLLPFTHTRPIADIRCGIFTMRERWELLLKNKTGTLTEQYLEATYPKNATDDLTLYINGGVFGNEDLCQAISRLKDGEALVYDSIVVAACHAHNHLGYAEFHDHIWGLPPVNYDKGIKSLRNVWDIFSLNDYALRADYQLITKGRQSAPIPDGIIVTGKENLFIEQGANIYAGCIINASSGPVYIGIDVVILEGSLIRGPFAACNNSLVKMGAKIYGPTTIGPGCKVGGENNNVVFFANSNKSHDGYLGNSVIGEWCNLGADTNSSNLKNNYDEVKIWSEQHNRMIPTGLVFCGLLMGDHSKCGINTMFNTGTVVGVSANIFGAGFPDKYIPSFSWGGADGFVTHEFDKAMETARRMMERRGMALTDNLIELYRYIFTMAVAQRN